MDYAKDYVDGIWIMLQKDKPDNYIFAINESHTVCEFVELSAKIIGIDLQWRDRLLGKKDLMSKQIIQLYELIDSISD